MTSDADRRNWELEARQYECRKAVLQMQRQYDDMLNEHIETILKQPRMPWVGRQVGRRPELVDWQFRDIAIGFGLGVLASAVAIFAWMVYEILWGGN